MKPAISEHPVYYTHYISLVKQDQITDAISQTGKAALESIKNLPADLGNYAYAEGKWTVKEVLIHCMDTERILSTRALGFARGEKQKSLSFDENVYAPNSEAHLRSLESISSEWESLNQSTLKLFGAFSENALAMVGETPSGLSTVNAIGFMICGHTLHHLNVLRERYLK